MPRVEFPATFAGWLVLLIGSTVGLVASLFATQLIVRAVG